MGCDEEYIAACFRQHERHKEGEEERDHGIEEAERWYRDRDEEVLPEPRRQNCGAGCGNACCPIYRAVSYALVQDPGGGTVDGGTDRPLQPRAYGDRGYGQAVGIGTLADYGGLVSGAVPRKGRQRRSGTTVSTPFASVFRL